MNNQDLGKILKQARIGELTLRDLAVKSGVSASHLGRIERGERYPSARVLRRIAKPLGFEEEELLILAGYLSPRPTDQVNERPLLSQLDPYVARVLTQEPIEVQRTVIGILNILKALARGAPNA